MQARRESALQHRQPARDARNRRGIIARLMLQEIDGLILRERARHARLEQHRRQYRALTHDEVIELLSAQRGGTPDEQADKMHFIAVNYRRITDALNHEAQRELGRCIRHSELRLAALLRRRQSLRKGNVQRMFYKFD